MSSRLLHGPLQSAFRKVVPVSNVQSGSTSSLSQDGLIKNDSHFSEDPVSESYKLASSNYFATNINISYSGNISNTGDSSSIYSITGGVDNSNKESRGKNKWKKNKRDELSRDDNEHSSPLFLSVSAPDLFEEITLVLTAVSEFLAPGFVIQRVRGNVSWLEEVNDQGMDCYFTGFVLEHEEGSRVAVSLCDGVVSRYG